jgi:hypothetical protein
MRESFALFLEATWQWISVGMAGTIRTHIIRSELEASARLLRIELTPTVFSDIRVMEAEAIKEWSRKKR